MSGVQYGQAAVDKLKAEVAELKKRNEGLVQVVADLTAELAAKKAPEAPVDWARGAPPRREGESEHRPEPAPQRHKKSDR